MMETTYKDYQFSYADAMRTTDTWEKRVFKAGIKGDLATALAILAGGHLDIAQCTMIYAHGVRRRGCKNHV